MQEVKPNRGLKQKDFKYIFQIYGKYEGYTSSIFAFSKNFV